LNIPGLGTTGVAGHAGTLALAEQDGRVLLLFMGRRHWYEGEGWAPVMLPVHVLRSLSARFLFLTNAAGGIREDLGPGTLMIIEDHINAMSTNPLTGPHDPFWGDRFPDQSEVYDPVMRNVLDRAGKAAGEDLARGVYLAAPGPTYETPAEIRAYRRLGADAVGMSTVPEAMLGHSAGLRVCALSCISNYAAGISPGRLTHEEVTSTTQAAMPRMKAIVAEFWKELAHVETD
jgi:inosine/guanosine/xanthosine phosphorylase family protein